MFSWLIFILFENNEHVKHPMSVVFSCAGDVGCHLDRHENIGKGKIGLDGFRRVMQEPRFDGIPMILETPLGDYASEIKILNRLASCT